MQKYGIDRFGEVGKDDDGEFYAVEDVDKEIEKWRIVEKELSDWRVAEKKTSDAYLRIRKLVGAWDTKSGGVDRFEVTEAAIKKLVDFWEWSRLADKMTFETYGGDNIVSPDAGEQAYNGPESTISQKT